MGNKNELKDEFISSMMKRIKLDSPSGQFTNNIMQQIQQESAQTVLDDSPVIGTKYWILIGASLVAAASILFFSDFSFIDNMFKGFGENIITEGISFNMMDRVKELLGSINVPPLLVISIIAITSLIVLDRFLKARFNTNLFMI